MDFSGKKGVYTGMTKNVIVSIQGLQFDAAQNDEELDKIETIYPGEYYFRNQAHYVLYEECLEGQDEPVKNMIKIRPQELVLTKKGPVNVQMVFDEGKKTMRSYATPFGNMLIAMDTTKVDVDENGDNVNVHIEYALEANYQYVADCSINVEIRSNGE